MAVPSERHVAHGPLKRPERRQVLGRPPGDEPRAVAVAPDLDRQRPDAGGQGCRRSGLSRLGLARGARPGHAVAYAAHVEDPGRVRRVVAELLVELFHEGAHDLGVAVAPPGPDPVQQRLGGRDPSGALSARARSSSYSVAVSSTSRPAMVTNRRS